MSETQLAQTPAVQTPEAIAAEAAKVVALHSAIKANFDNKVDIKEVKFHFKKVKDEKTGVESKRPTVELVVPVPSVEGIIAILEAGGKDLELLQEAVADIVIGRAREIVNDKEGVTQETFPLEALKWATIAVLPKAERRGGGISKEVWEEFAKDYIAVMPGVTSKTEEQVSNAAKIYLNKFNAVKTQKQVLSKLVEQLTIYVNNTSRGDEFGDCVSFLVDKANRLLQMDEAELLANL